MKAEEIVDRLQQFSRYEIPDNVIVDVRDNVSRYGRLKLFKKEAGGDLVLYSDDALLILQLLGQKSLQPYLSGSPVDSSVSICVRVRCPRSSRHIGDAAPGLRTCRRSRPRALIAPSSGWPRALRRIASTHVVVR